GDRNRGRNKKDKKSAKNLAEKEAQENLYREFFDFSAEARTCPPSRLFEMLRAEKAKAVEVRLVYPKERLMDSTFENVFSRDNPFADYLKKLLQETFNTTILPSMEKELRREFIDRAEMQALDIIERNLRNLVLLHPLDRRRVLAIDPGFNHGCKLAALDEFGNILALDSVFTTGSGERKRKAAERISALIRKFHLTVVGIGNGTGSRETENFIANLLSEQFSSEDIGYTAINEAGASAYAASPLGKEELPSYNILQREAISIGRRIQDTLQELVKIDPALLGIGMEIRDLKSKDVRNVLADLLEYAVNLAGADLNRASASFLKYIAGLNPITAQRICDYRKKNGPFKNREDLKKVPGLSEDAYHYAVGFLRIPSGYEPLDSTWIHPDQYGAARKILEKFGFAAEDLKSEEKRKEIAQKVQEADLPALASEFELGILALHDMLNEFVHPGLDRRLALPGLIFKKGTLRFEDLKEGMELVGTVQNVVNFGAFIDIGLPQSGLVHISVMGDQFVRDAHQKVVLGDIVKVWVVKADPVQKRISLTMIPPGHERTRYSGPKNRKPDRESVGAENAPAVQSDQENRSSSRPDRNFSSDRNRRSSDSDREFRSKDRSSDRPRRDRDRSIDSEEGQNSRNRNFSRERRDKTDKKQSFSRDHSTLEIPSAKAKKVVPLSDEMKKGKEPMRSFSDLAQFFGISKPEEE
ncbi:MAG: helix-hairpin-helix domain-containing protein, partial [Planctomycetia bacterium]|nr:helix-hairpin-helix domain-containing protein [Planctomycetia bacterium]